VLTPPQAHSEAIAIIDVIRTDNRTRLDREKISLTCFLDGRDEHSRSAWFLLLGTPSVLAKLSQLRQAIKGSTTLTNPRKFSRSPAPLQ